MEENNNTNTTPEEPKEPKKEGNFFQNLLNTPDTTADYDPADIEKNKGMTILAYIGILVLIPIFAVKDSPYTKYHCNQGLILLICGLIAGALSWIPVLGWIISLLVFVLFIIGLLNAINGKAKELPCIGKFRLLK